MKITSINLNAISQVKQRKTSFFQPIFKSNLDEVRFSSKTPEQLVLVQEAKELSKQAYGVLARSKNIKEQAKMHLDNSVQIWHRAKELYGKSQEEFIEIQDAFEYAKENKTKAIADPFKNTQTIFTKNAIEVYSDNHLLKKAQKVEDKIILFEYPKSKKVKKSVFDVKTGELIEFSDNYKQISSKGAACDVRFTFANGNLVSCDYGVFENSKTRKIQKSYVYNNNQLSSFAANLSQNKDWEQSIEQEFLFDGRELISYQKDSQIEDINRKSVKESYIFSFGEMQYLSNSTLYPRCLKTTDKMIYFKDSKVKKIIIGAYDDFSVKTAAKHFEYSQNERPSRCYLNPQSANASEFSDEPMFYGKLIYLG